VRPCPRCNMAMTLRKKKDSNGYFLGTASYVVLCCVFDPVPMPSAHNRMHRVSQVQSHYVDARGRIYLRGGSMSHLQHKQRHCADARVQLQAWPSLLCHTAPGAALIPYSRLPSRRSRRTESHRNCFTNAPTVPTVCCLYRGLQRNDQRTASPIVRFTLISHKPFVC
jgi:hypothetical protein